MEVRPREIIASITIVAIMLIVGTFGADALFSKKNQTTYDYQTATQIESNELFKHSINTSMTNLLLKGTIITNDPVIHDLIDGEYMEIEAIEEHYVMKSRLVSYKCGDNTCYKTEFYWEWDVVGRKTTKSKSVNFLGIDFERDRFKGLGRSRHSTVKVKSNVRYKMNVIEKDVDTVAYIKDLDGNFTTYQGRTFENVIDEIKTGEKVAKGVYWLFMMSITSLIVYQFVYQENDWLY